MNIDDFLVGQRFETVDLNVLIDSDTISDSRRNRLIGLKNQWVPGDDVFYYCSEKELWDALMGSEGYILVRERQVIDNVVLKMIRTLQTHL